MDTVELQWNYISIRFNGMRVVSNKKHKQKCMPWQEFFKALHFPASDDVVKFAKHFCMFDGQYSIQPGFRIRYWFLISFQKLLECTLEIRFLILTQFDWHTFHFKAKQKLMRYGKLLTLLHVIGGRKQEIREMRSRTRILNSAHCLRTHITHKAGSHSHNVMEFNFLWSGFTYANIYLHSYYK